MSDQSPSYDLDLSASDSALIVRVHGRITTEVGRHVREIVLAAEKCGLPVEVKLPAHSHPVAR